MRKIFLFLSAVILSGCAGSPLHTSGMNQYEIMHVDDVTLCRASIPRSAYTPSSVVMLEVRRRRVNCQQLLPYEQPTAQTVQQQPVIIQQQAPMMMPNPAACIQDGGSTYCPRYRR